MTGLELSFHPGLLIAGALLATALLLWSYLRLRGSVRPLHLAGLLGLRAAALVFLLLILFNPFLLRNHPDPGQFRVAVLADASGSMEIADVGEGETTRFNLIQRWLEGNERNSPLAALRARDYRLEAYLFSESAIPYVGGEAEILAGRTALGTVLQERLDPTGTAQGDPLAAVLILSDGQVNLGPSPMETARRYRELGIPISAVGIGSRTPPGDARASFATTSFQGKAREPIELPVTLSNTRAEAANLKLRLYDENGLLEERDMNISAGTAEEQIYFSVIPQRKGVGVYRLVSTDTSQSTATEQTDFAVVAAEEPEKFSVLYLGAHLSMEYRFLQQAAEDTDQIQLESIIKTGPDSFFHSLSSESERNISSDSFPEGAEFFNRYEAILLDTRSLGAFSEAAKENLRDFVSRRGGGILLFGPPEAVDEPLASLLPVVVNERVNPARRGLLQVQAAPVFHHLAGGALFGRPAPFIGEDLNSVVTTQWKRGARPVLFREGEEAAFMTVQAYGAGRVGYLGIEHTWQWRMDSDTGMQQHQLFWDNLLVWLASSGKPRTSVPFHGRKVPVQEALDLDIDVMGADFRPSRDASVSARVTSPSGESRQWILQPSFSEPGRYTTEFVPSDAGEYHVQYDIEFSGGERLEHESLFVADHSAEEMENTAYREDLLRDVARLTGGNFWHHSDASGIRDIPLAKTTPMRSERHYLADQNWFISLLFLSLLIEWYLRRNLGLK